jgi:hypothetical protein
MSSLLLGFVITPQVAKAKHRVVADPGFRWAPSNNRPDPLCILPLSILLAVRPLDEAPARHPRFPFLSPLCLGSQPVSLGGHRLVAFRKLIGTSPHLWKQVLRTDRRLCGSTSRNSHPTTPFSVTALAATPPRLLSAALTIREATVLEATRRRPLTSRTTPVLCPGTRSSTRPCPSTGLAALSAT